MSLTSELIDPTSAASVWMREHLDHKPLRDAWARARPNGVPVPRGEHEGPLGLDLGLVGSAVHLAFTWRYGAPSWELVSGVELLSERPDLSRVCRGMVALLDGPRPESFAEAVRASVLLAAVEQYRRSGIFGEALAAFRAPSLAAAMAEVPDSLADEVARMLVYLDDEYPDDGRAVVVAPTFGQSSVHVGGADADLLFGSTLVEIKTTVLPDLAARDARQILGYVLLDEADQYGMAGVEVVNPRHGRVLRIDAEGLLADCMGLAFAGLPEARASFGAAIRAGWESGRVA